MIFILVTGSIMAISISLIYRLCRFFDIEMKWAALVLCAVMAFIVNGVAISMSPFLDRAHYVHLALLVISAAALVTFFNEKLLSREETARKTADEADAAPVTDPVERPDAPCFYRALPTETLPAEDPPMLPADDTQSGNVSAQNAALQEQEAAAAAQARLKARQAAIDAKLAQKAAAEKAIRAVRRIRYIREIEAMDSLDSILDYAYKHRQQEPDAAICAYQQAIARYPADSYTPFLIIELGNLYKDQANYHEAISTYAKALNMPIIAVDDAMKREFSKNIRYLGTVQDILSEHHALSTPFREISIEIMQEIEDEFLQRSQQSN